MPRLLALLALLAVALTATTAQAKPRKAAKVSGESTTFTLAPAVVDRIGDLGIELGVVAPATKAGPGSVTFPITKVRGPVHRLRGVVRHDGGLTLTRGARSVSLSKLVVVADGRRGYATAKVGQRRVRLFRLTSPERSVDGSKVSLTVDLRLTAQGARWLNRRLPAAQLEPGLLVGSATLSGTLGAPASEEYADPFED